MKNKTALLIVTALTLAATGYAAENRVGVQVRGEHEHMFVSGDGHKAWYSALELAQIATDYARTNKLDFQFEGTEQNVWVHTDGGKVLAEVWFSPLAGGPALQVQIGRKGTVLKHKFETKSDKESTKDKGRRASQDSR
jgi:hypothetical protein